MPELRDDQLLENPQEPAASYPDFYVTKGMAERPIYYDRLAKWAGRGAVYNLAIGLHNYRTKEFPGIKENFRLIIQDWKEFANERHHDS